MRMKDVGIFFVNEKDSMMRLACVTDNDNLHK